MDINPFKKFLSSLSQISQLNFEVWDMKQLVFSSRPDETDISISEEIRDFSARIVSRTTFQHALFNGQHAINGVSIKDEEQIIGTLLAYSSNFNKRPKPSDFPNISHAGEMETFLTSLARLMEDKWAAQKEIDAMADELGQSFEDFYLFSRIATQIKTLRFSNAMQKKLVKDILKTMRMDMAFVIMPDRQEKNVFVNKVGTTAEIKTFIKTLIDAIPPDASSLTDNYFIINDSTADPTYKKLHSDPFRFLTVKVQRSDNFYGWLGMLSFNLKEIFRRSELRLLISMAEQLALVIDNTDLYHDLENFIISMIKSLVYAIEAKDVYTRGHSERVSNFCMLMADHLELEETEKKALQWASILHDVGKIGVPEKILNKKERLDDKEYRIIKEHPQKGFNILRPLEQLSDALPGVLHHHERYDGTGYPKGLKGEEIPLQARIIAVADTFDAIASERAYRAARSHEEAMTIIEKVVGAQLDPYLVLVFKDVLTKTHNKMRICGWHNQASA